MWQLLKGRGNYYLLWGFECGNYTKEETIQGGKLFVEIQYVQPFTINSYIRVGWLYKNPVLRKNLNGLGFKVSDFDVSCLKAVVQCATSANNRNFWIHYNDHIDIGIVLLHMYSKIRQSSI